MLALPVSSPASPTVSVRRRRRSRHRRLPAALMTSPEDFVVGRFLGSYGFMNITSYTPLPLGGISDFGRLSGLTVDRSPEDVERMRTQDVGEGQVKIRLYQGRVAQGPLNGTKVLFKVYPGLLAGNSEADMMAANELSAHASLQDDADNICENIQYLLGAFETMTGEQWLAFRDDGSRSAATFARMASERISYESSNRNWWWSAFDSESMLKSRRFFVLKLLNGAIRGLAFMHDHDMLHQSLGPSSVILNTTEEKDARVLVPQLRDLAFSLDIRVGSIGIGTLSQGLWRRASAAGALTSLEKRAFGIADDIYEAGLLLAYMSFVPFSEAGAIDGVSLQRLLESTFQLDVYATREYCMADDRLVEAVNFLDLGDGAGWELLQAMLNPDYRRRPIAEAVLNHRFMTGAVL